MRQRVIIENPVINSLFEEPRTHFRFAEDGITDEIVEARRISACFVPIPASVYMNRIWATAFEDTPILFSAR